MRSFLQSAYNAFAGLQGQVSGRLGGGEGEGIQRRPSSLEESPTRAAGSKSSTSQTSEATPGPITRSKTRKGAQLYPWEEFAQTRRKKKEQEQRERLQTSSSEEGEIASCAGAPKGRADPKKGQAEPKTLFAFPGQPEEKNKGERKGNQERGGETKEGEFSQRPKVGLRERQQQ